MDGIASEAEDAARQQHMRTLYGLTKCYAMKDLRAAQPSLIRAVIS